MLVDMLNTDNYVSFNIRLAHIFGLSGAVYASELISIYQKAYRKDRLEEQFMRLDRDYMTRRTTITREEQLLIDSRWEQEGLITKGDDGDLISLNINMMISIIAEENPENIEEVSKLLKFKTESEKRADKQYSIVKGIKNGMVCSNDELRTALFGWIDSIVQRYNGYITKDMVTNFQKTLNEYAKGDLDLALSIVGIATTQGWRDCSWAINSYERGKRINVSKQRVTEQKVATENTVNKSELF